MEFKKYIFFGFLLVSNVLPNEGIRGLPIEIGPLAPQTKKLAENVPNDERPQLSIHIEPEELNLKKNKSKKDLVENKQPTDDHFKNEEKSIKGSVKKQLKPIGSGDVKNPVQNNTSIMQTSVRTTIDSVEPQNIESDAVMRGVLVFVGIGMLFLVYVGCKTYRRKPNIKVRKYGVRARRSDVEMTPLPLNEDEEDETLFDVGTLNRT